MKDLYLFFRGLSRGKIKRPHIYGRVSTFWRKDIEIFEDSENVEKENTIRKIEVKVNF